MKRKFGAILSLLTRDGVSHLLKVFGLFKMSWWVCNPVGDLQET